MIGPFKSICSRHEGIFRTLQGVTNSFRRNRIETFTLLQIPHKWSTQVPGRLISNTGRLQAREKCVCEASNKQPAMPYKPYGTHSLSGAVKQRPIPVRFPVVRFLAVVIPFIYLGGTASHYAAWYLYEYEIFVPEDEDNEDEFIFIT